MASPAADRLPGAAVPATPLQAAAATLEAADVTRGRLTSFVAAGERRQIKDPDGLASARQLVWLNARGCLASPPLTKGEAAYLIDQARRREENTR